MTTFKASGETAIPRAATDGRDGINGEPGISIDQADVIFCQHTSSNAANPPADNATWKTTFAQLTLTEGNYLWSATRIQRSNGSSTITGKYCMGKVEDFSQVEELYAISKSSTQAPSKYESTYTPTKGYWLWSIIRYTSVSKKNATTADKYAYSQPQCVGYFGDDGTQGVGVASVDVVFAVSQSRAQTPALSEQNWKTQASDLQLREGYYLWTCTLTKYTQGKASTYTGIYCLGRCEDFSEVTELYALGTSGTNAPTLPSSESDTSTWKSTYTAQIGKYLWTCTRIIFNSQNSGTRKVTYQNIRCSTYFPKDGTNGISFTPMGTAYAHYEKATQIPAPTMNTLLRKYLVDVDDKNNIPKPCVCYWQNTSTFKSTPGSENDAYNIDGTLWVHNGTVWKDFGNVKGADGNDGQDAILVTFNPPQLSFKADDSGRVQGSEAQKGATLVVRRGSQDVTGYTIKPRSIYVNQCEATWSQGKLLISKIPSTAIEGFSDAYVPCSAGGAGLIVVIDGKEYPAYLPYTVDIETFAASVVKTSKEYQQKYTEVSNKTNTLEKNMADKASKDDLTQMESTITQNARQISLSVTEKSMGRRNLLRGSSFRKQGEVYFTQHVVIEKNSGIDGINCIRAYGQYSGSGDGDYLGAYWDASQSSPACSLPIQKGKKYTISCWIKCDSTLAAICLECIYTSKLQGGTRYTDGAARKSIRVANVGSWELHTLTIDTTNAPSSYLAVNFWMNPKLAGTDVTVNCCFCKPMVEQSEEYNGWSLSPDDYTYVGGNLFDNTRTLSLGGNLNGININSLPSADFSDYGDCRQLRVKSTTISGGILLRFDASTLQFVTDYLLSFLAKGSGILRAIIRYASSSGTAFYSEDSQGNVISSSGVQAYSICTIPAQLTGEYNRFWSHFRFLGDQKPQSIEFLLQGTGEVYLCQPKLEEGATLTEWTERKTDLVDKASLKKAGIEITTDQVKLYGDKVQVLTRKDGTTQYDEAAMFSNGKLNANLINAETIVVNGLQGKNIDAKNATIQNLNVTDVSLEGTLRSNYMTVKDGNDLSKTDNIYIENYDWFSFFKLKWDATQIGRTIRIANYTTSGAAISAPDSTVCFYTGGVKTNMISIPSGRCCVMHGLGHDGTFVAWCIENTYEYKSNLVKKGMTYMLRGFVEYKPSTKTIDITQSPMTTNEGKLIYVTATRRDVGLYRLTLPYAIARAYKDVDSVTSLITRIGVMVTGFGGTYDVNNNTLTKAPVKASVEGIYWDSTKTTINIDIWVSDDETVNDGCFQFLIYNLDNSLE